MKVKEQNEGRRSDLSKSEISKPPPLFSENKCRFFHLSLLSSAGVSVTLLTHCLLTLLIVEKKIPDTHNLKHKMFISLISVESVS